MFDDDTMGTKKTAPIEGFKMGRSSVTALLMKELGATTATVAVMKDIYKEIISLKIARGKKDPETTGTVGYIIYPDGVLEEMADKTKLSQLPWATLQESAIVIGYLSQRDTTYRVYNGARLSEMFGVTEDDSF